MTAKERTVKQEYRRNHSARKMARRLGWVSIGLGVAELLMPGPIARTLGIPAARGFIRLCGLREVVTGVGLLKSEQPKPWMTARVAGDALDLTRLSGAILVGNKPEHAMLATAAIAGVTSMDMAAPRRSDCRGAAPVSPGAAFRKKIHDSGTTPGSPPSGPAPG